MERKTSKQLILFVIVFIVLLISVVGFTYAFFTYQRTSGDDTVVKAGQLMLGYIEETNGIEIQDAVPKSDDDALNTENASDYFDFYISYALPTSASIKYEIDIENITEDILGEDTTYFVLESDRVKLALENRSEVYPDNPLLVGPTYLSTLELTPASNEKAGYKFYDKTVTGTGKVANDYYRLYMWIPEVDSAGKEIPLTDTVDGVKGIQNRAFSIRVNVQALAQVNE